jgi:hypothetical protein
MSLEERIAANTEALKVLAASVGENVAAINQLLAGASAAAASRAGAEPAPKATRATKKDKADDAADNKAEDGPSEDFLARREDFRGKLSAWLTEFKSDESDPENEARKARLGKAYENLGFKESLKECVDDTTLDKLIKFLVARVAEGRMTPLPVAATAAATAGDDEI